MYAIDVDAIDQDLSSLTHHENIEELEYSNITPLIKSVMSQNPLRSQATSKSGVDLIEQRGAKRYTITDNPLTERPRATNPYLSNEQTFSQAPQELRDDVLADFSDDKSLTLQ